MGRRDHGADHRETQGLLGPYVLGALEPGEEREVKRHLEACAGCRKEERGLRETHERLAGAAIAGAAAPPHLKDRVLAALPPQEGLALPVGESERTRRLRLVAPVAAALLVAGALAAYFGGIFGPADTAALEPTGLAPGAGGEVEIERAPAATKAELEVWGLPQTGSNEYYELWFGREEGRVSAGTFTVDDEGRGRLSTTCPKVSAGDYQRVGVTLERFPEEPRQDSAKVVLGGELQGS
jgi:putative zinc finger protein/anti-sigma-K factor RskA